jgi:hypothetical protein
MAPILSSCSVAPPSGDETLQCPAHTWVDLGMATAEFLEDRNRTQARSGFQYRHNLALPDPGERIGTAAAVRLLALHFDMENQMLEPAAPDRQTSVPAGTHACQR